MESRKCRDYIVFFFFSLFVHSDIDKIHHTKLSFTTISLFLRERDTPTSLKSPFMESERIDKRNLQVKITFFVNGVGVRVQTLISC